MDKRELAVKLDEAIGSQKHFPWDTFGERIVKHLDKIQTADDLYVATLITRKKKIGTEEVWDTMTAKQRERAWQVLVDEGVVNPDAEFEYRFTADIWGYEPGVGKCQSEYDEVFTAANDTAARRLAEKRLTACADYRWSPWEADDKG